MSITIQRQRSPLRVVKGVIARSGYQSLEALGGFAGRSPLLFTRKPKHMSEVLGIFFPAL